mgnify:CR=1 FL=1
MTAPLSATSVLREEHARILKLLDAMAEAVTRIAAGEHPPTTWLESFHEFLEATVEGSHHRKEEGVFFAALVDAGLPESGVITRLEEEHKRCRALLTRLEEQVGEQAKWAETATDYIELYRSHIALENELLFAVAEDLLSDEEQRTLAERMGSVGEPPAKLQERLGGLVDGFGRRIELSRIGRFA